MIFFPGEKFGVAEQLDPNSPELYLRLCEHDDGVETYARIIVNGKSASAEKYYTYSADYGKEKTVKLAIKHGCPVEFVLKDISTVSHRPENLIIWAKTVSDVLDEYYDKA